MTRPFRVGDIVRTTAGDGGYYQKGVLARLTTPPRDGQRNWLARFRDLGNPPGSFDADGYHGDGEWYIIGNQFELAERPERQFNADGTPIPEAGDIVRCICTEPGLWTEGNLGKLIFWDDQRHTWETGMTDLQNLKGSCLSRVWLSAGEFVVEQRHEEIEHGT